MAEDATPTTPEADLRVMSKHSVGKRIAANAGLMVGSKSLAVLLGLGSLAVATKNLSVYEFGSLVFLHAYMLFFSEVATFQSWQSIIRFGSDDLKSKSCENLVRLFNFTIRLDILSALLAYILSVSIFSGVVWAVQSFPNLIPASGAAEVAALRNYAVIYCLLVLIRQRGTSIGVFSIV